MLAFSVLISIKARPVDAEVVTASVNICVASGKTPFAAIMVKLYMPVGMAPAIERSPDELLMLTPAGSLPSSDQVIGEIPVAVA